MALALLEALDVDRGNLRFQVDTGTNRYYQLKFGRGVERRHGIEWVDDVVLVTPMAINRSAGASFDTDLAISVPRPPVDRGRAYVQLFTYKSADGTGPAFSAVVPLAVGGGAGSTPGRMGHTGQPGPPVFPGLRPIPGLPSFPGQPGLPGMLPSVGLPSLGMSMIESAPLTFEPPRRVPCRTYADAFSATPALGDLLSRVVQVATPVVLELLRGGEAAGSVVAATGGPGGTSGGTSGAAAGPAAGGLAGVPAQAIAGLVAAILEAIPGAGRPGVSGQQSLHARAESPNRFDGPDGDELARPFIFGIDDAILGAVIGQVVQVLPALANATNQKRIAIKQADNKLVGDIVSDINRRMILDRVLEAQRQASPGSPATADLNQLAQLLQSAQAAQAAQQAPTNGAAAPAGGSLPAASPPVPATTQSLAEELAATGQPSSKAVLAFETAEPLPWSGSKRHLFVRGEGLQLRIRLTVAEPAPKSPLPKAILRLVFKDATGARVLGEKVTKLKGLAANAITVVPVAADELGRLPANEPIQVLAELRWPSADGRRVVAALGSTEITLVDRFFVKERGAAAGREVELTDMNRYRAFWNKVWESPTLDAARTRKDEKKHLWELDVTGKYTILLSPDEDANGLMETKVLQARKDRDSLADRTEGRLKAGIELSISELNKLSPLWNGRAPLDPEKLAAFRTSEFAKLNGGELVHGFRLKGRAGERGMFWVIPTFRLVEFTLGAPDKTDESGQVVSLREEKVALPMPVAVRAIGLRGR